MPQIQAEAVIYRFVDDARTLGICQAASRGDPNARRGTGMEHSSGAATASCRAVPRVAPTRPWRGEKERPIVWWQDLLLGIWNGVTAWIVLLLHSVGIWEEFPFYDLARRGNWYDFGFLLG